MASTITILGSGTCVPSLTRNPSSVLVQTGPDNLLFDCGPGVMRRLLEVGVLIGDLTHIFISHHHPDHVGELASLLFALKYPTPTSAQTPLTIVAGQGFGNFYARLKGVWGHWIELPPERLKIFELDTERQDHLNCTTFSVTTRPVEHRPESLAFRIEDAQGRSMVYSGDTDESQQLVALARHADLMICESATPDGQKIEGHLTPSLAGRMAAQAGVKRLVLTHFYPACDQADIEKQCRSTYTGPVILATDRMTLEL